MNNIKFKEGVMILKRFLLFYFLIFLLILGCKKNTKSINSTNSFPNNKEINTANTKTSNKAVFIPDKVIQITAEKYRFIPDTITVKKGTKVRLQVKSIDTTHGFAILEMKINEKLKPGRVVNIDFVADKPGEYTYFCSVPCGPGHRQMRGKLIIK